MYNTDKREIFGHGIMMYDASERTAKEIDKEHTACAPIAVNVFPPVESLHLC